MGGNGATLFNNLISHGKQKKDDVIYVDNEKPNKTLKVAMILHRLHCIWKENKKVMPVMEDFKLEAKLQ